MNINAIIGSPKRPRAGYITIISGVLLGSFAAAAPAQSGDFYAPYEYASHRYGPSGYYPRNCSPCGCYSCGCSSCGCVRCGCCGTAQRRSHVVERRWVEREYYERRYPVGGYRYPAAAPPCCSDYERRYQSYGYPGGYPHYSGYSGASGWEAPRPHLGYGGIVQPAPVSYDYEAPPRRLYVYEPRPAYDYEMPPRPPVGIPAGYYDGYVE